MWKCLYTSTLWFNNTHKHLGTKGLYILVKASSYCQKEINVSNDPYVLGKPVVPGQRLFQKQNGRRTQIVDVKLKCAKDTVPILLVYLLGLCKDLRCWWTGLSSLFSASSGRWRGRNGGGGTHPASQSRCLPTNDQEPTTCEALLRQEL